MMKEKKKNPPSLFASKRAKEKNERERERERERKVAR
jgi:hypothetical protein